MIEWLRRLNWMIIAMVAGPLLVVISLVALRGQLWGPALVELNVLVKQHDNMLKGIEERQREILHNQERLLETVKNHGDILKCR